MMERLRAWFLGEGQATGEGAAAFTTEMFDAVLAVQPSALLDFAAHCWRASDGRFDVTSGVLRRCWRFGQTMPVNCHLIVAEGEEQIGRVIDRKAADHAAMNLAMREAMRRDAAQGSAVRVAYQPTHIGEIPPWLNA